MGGAQSYRLGAAKRQKKKNIDEEHISLENNGTYVTGSVQYVVKFFTHHLLMPHKLCHDPQIKRRLFNVTPSPNMIFLLKGKNEAAENVSR